MNNLREQVAGAVTQKLVDAALHVSHVDVDGLATKITDAILPLLRTKDLWKSVAKLRDEEKVLCEYVTSTPALLSLLYDIGLLPEQTMGTRDFGRTMMIAAYWRKEFSPAAVGEVEK